MADTQKTTENDKKELFESLELKYQEAVILRFSGMQETKIAKELNEKYATVRQWFEKGGICYASLEQLKAERTRLNRKRVKKLDEQIQNTLPDMVDALYESGKRGNWMAAQSLLDRGGYSPLNKTQITIDPTVKNKVMEILKGGRKQDDDSNTQTDTGHNSPTE